MQGGSVITDEEEFIVSKVPIKGEVSLRGGDHVKGKSCALINGLYLSLENSCIGR